MADPQLVSITPENVEDFGIHCVGDRRHPGRIRKVEWFRREYPKGLRIQLLHSPRARKSVGFVEYAPGTSCWRAIDAPDYLVIHCIWVKASGRGHGSRLIEEVVAEARAQKRPGVAVVASSGPWCAKPTIFEKNGFLRVDERPPYGLYVRKLKRSAKNPRFVDGPAPARRKGVVFRYSFQCPYVAKSLEELAAEADTRKAPLELVEIKTARQARRSPTPYGVTSIVGNGKVLADHAISRTRFRNILREEGLGEGKRR